MVDGHSGPARGTTYSGKRFGGEHPSFVWTRHSGGHVAAGLKSPCTGYAPPEYRKKPWPTEAQIAGWFPFTWESVLVSLPRVV